MGVNDGRPGLLEHLAGGLVAAVGQVDNHSQAIHLLDDRPPERGEAAFGERGRGARPRDITFVGEGQVADPEGVHGAKDAEGTAQGVSPFHADHRGELATAVRFDDLFAGGGEGGELVVEHREALNDVDLLERQLDRV